MEKSLLIILGLTASTVAAANHCPAPNQIFIKQGNKYVTQTPPGWQWTSSWGGAPEFQSDNVQLNWVMWSSERMFPEDENRVHCIYGNPTFNGSKTGGLLQTVDLIDRQQVENGPNWKAYGENYLRCISRNVLDCIFS